MRLAALADHLRRQLLRTAPFARASVRHPYLARYPSLQAVLAQLGQREQPDHAANEDLTLALLEQYQASVGAEAGYWAAALTLAYLPMLASLRARLRPRGADADRDQLVLESFLGVCARFPTVPRRGRTPAWLRGLTARAVFAALAKERRAPVPVEATEQLEPEPWLGRPARSPGRERERFLRELRAGEGELAALLQEHAGRALAPAKLTLVAQTVLAGRSVAAHVRTTHAGLPPAEQRRAYLRASKQVGRAVVELRAALAPLERELRAG